MKRKAEARWTGTLKGGSGQIKLGSGAYEGPYDFVSRFESGKVTNPEELLGAALAACFSMALSSTLAQAGHTVRSVDTTAQVFLEKGETGGSSITKIELSTRGDVEGVSAEEFAKVAEETRKGCIVARALSAVPTSLEVEFAGV